jgi:DnaJ-domain-containing protein 1
MGMKWVWIILAILYVLSRIDLIPDVIPGWGWIDDIVVLALLYRYLAKRRRATNPFQQRQGYQQPTENPSTAPRTAYDILGVTPTASKVEIRAAYRRLANQYHPDKVTHLGQEFQDLAERRFKEIQQAYQQLK